MWKKHLRDEERERIKELLVLWRSNYAIGKELWYAHTTIDREIERNSVNWKYSPIRAGKLAKQRREKANTWQTKLLNDKSLRDKLLRKLKHQTQDWTPDTIVWRMKEKDIETVCTKTFYNYIHNHDPTLKEYLKYGKKWYRKRRNNPRVWKFTWNVKRIEERPAIVERRERIGDWELDTVVSNRKWKWWIVTCFDRTSRYCEIKKVNTLKAEEVWNTLREILWKHKKNRLKTLTSDNGKEFADYDLVEIHLDADYFFCNTYASYERGTNEQGNGCIRKFYPKWTDFSEVKDEELMVIQEKLNRKPRKVLKYMTPYEVFYGKKSKYFS
jgi:IS30 family transposase